MTNRSPAAVDKAAARPPAATRAITHPGNCVILGLGYTIITFLI